MRFAEICRTAVAEYARRLAWDVGCGSYVVVAQGRRGPQASCRINGTQGKTAASGDSCSRNCDGIFEKQRLRVLRAAAGRCRGCGCAACLVQENGPNDLKRASRGGRRSGRKKRCESDTQARKCPRNRWWGSCRYFRCKRRPAVEAVVFGWLRALLVSDGNVDRPGALSG
jgi:hypothetical protein